MITKKKLLKNTSDFITKQLSDGDQVTVVIEVHKQQVRADTSVQMSYRLNEYVGEEENDN